MRGIILIIVMSLFLSCSYSKNPPRVDPNPSKIKIVNGYFLNGVGEWEKIHNHDHWEGSKGIRTRQTFAIGDNTKYFTPGSIEAIEWIAKRRRELRESAIRQGRNPDFYIDIRINEGEAW